MGENGGLELDGDFDNPGGSFSRLLLSADDANKSSNVPAYSSAHPCPMFSSATPKMLCFGDAGPEFSQLSSTLTYSDSSSASSSGNNINIINNNKRRNGSGQESGQGVENGQRNGTKKNKPEMGPAIAASVGHAKVRGKREKLGERIATLQQLVCPYGKTDSASVLHEAMGYIRFLHDQVKVLSSPYLQHLPSSSSPHNDLSLIQENGAVNPKGKESARGLRNRGLCLVPAECIIDTGNMNGADFWSSLRTS